jgi:hypothetical protein
MLDDVATMLQIDYTCKKQLQHTTHITLHRQATITTQQVTSLPPCSAAVYMLNEDMYSFTYNVTAVA